MTTTPDFFSLLHEWDISKIVAWEALQENVFRITLPNDHHFVLKAIGAHTETIAQRLHFEYDVLSHVVATGVVAAVPLLAQAGKPYVIADGQIYRLSHWLPNRLTEPKTMAEYTQLYRSYGAAIARFHAALAGYPSDNLTERTWATDLQTRVLNEAVPVVRAHLDSARLSAFEDAMLALGPAMEEAYLDLPRQLIIWDCHPGNVAVDGLEVSGFIDLDHLSVAPRVLDLADFLVHLMKWDLADNAKLATWLTHVPGLLASYEAVAPLSTQEKSALYYAMLAQPVIFMDFFFQNGRPELTETEFALFMWLVRRRSEIVATIM